MPRDMVEIRQYVIFIYKLEDFHINGSYRIRRGKLNSLFIVTAHMDFQTFSKFSDFIFNTLNTWHFEPHSPN